MNRHSARKSKMGRGGASAQGSVVENVLPTNQSILVSGESGAGKTVTTKIVLNYFAMLSKKVSSFVMVVLCDSKQQQQNLNLFFLP